MRKRNFQLLGATLRLPKGVRNHSAESWHPTRGMKSRNTLPILEIARILTFQENEFAQYFQWEGELVERNIDFAKDVRAKEESHPFACKWVNQVPIPSPQKSPFTSR